MCGVSPHRRSCASGWQECFNRLKLARFMMAHFNWLKLARFHVLARFMQARFMQARFLHVRGLPA
jgi:hypothetical protein